MGYRYYTVTLWLCILALFLDVVAVTLCVVYEVCYVIPILLFALSFLLIYKLWKLIRYPREMIEFFLLSLRCGERMMRFPKTKDRYIASMHEYMNSIIALYRKNMNDIEVKKNIYDKTMLIMAHEMRNTLSPIISLSEYYIDNENNISLKELKSGMRVVNDQSKNLKKFLDTYQTLIHLPEPKIEKIFLPAFLKEVESLICNEPNGDKIEFLSANVYVYADAIQLKQLLVNILHNAIFAVSDYDDAHIELCASMSGKSTMITVVDNGCGIPRSKLKDIFQPFYTTRQNGTGVGLALSRRIMLLHGGDISVESNTETRYTKFTMLFPNDIGAFDLDAD